MSHLKLRINYWFAIILLLGWSCNDQIDLPVPRGGDDPIVVIQGIIAKTKSNVTSKVYISNSSSSSSFAAYIRVTSVVIENSLGQKVKLVDGDDGGYITNIPLNSPSFDTKPGVKYKLIVVDFKQNKYESGFEEIISGSTLSNPKFAVEERSVSTSSGVENIKYFTSTVDINKQPNSGTLFKFDYELSYSIQEGIVGQPPRPRKCYVTNLIETKGITLQETKNLTLEKYKNYPTFETELDSKFAEQAYVNVIMGTINEGAKEYFEQLNLLRSGDVSIFQPQGDRLTSNLTTTSNAEVPVIGYFYGSFQDTARMKINPSQVGNPKHICPTTLNEVGACNFPACCNCLQLKGSSTTKPYFWQ